MKDWEYKWENAPYDTQMVIFMRERGSHRQRLGFVERQLQARQFPDSKMHVYKAQAFGVSSAAVFDTQQEAMAWVVACERIR